MSETKKATFELSVEIHKALKMLSIQKDINMSELAENALREYLRKEGITVQ